MDERGATRRGRWLVLLVGSAVLVAGAGIAVARTGSGPPFAEPLPAASDPVQGGVAVQELDPAEVEVVQTYFDAFADGCGNELLGEADLADAVTVEAFGALIEALDGGQTSHGVQGIRSVLANCQDHANDGLRNALYHHGLNWLRHAEHERWLEEKFAEKWPDGKPGNGPHATGETVARGKPEEPGAAGAVHGNPHATGSSLGGNGNAFGHSKH